MKKSMAANKAERLQREHQVLVLGGTPARRAVVALAVRISGHSVVEATTPLEAIARLVDGDSQIGTALIAGDLGDLTGEVLTGFLMDEFPDVHMVAAHRVCRSGENSRRGIAGAQLAIGTS